MITLLYIISLITVFLAFYKATQRLWNRLWDSLLQDYYRYKQQLKTKPDTFKMAYGLSSGIYNGQAKTLDDNTPKLRLEA